MSCTHQAARSSSGKVSYAVLNWNSCVAVLLSKPARKSLLVYRQATTGKCCLKSRLTMAELAHIRGRPPAWWHTSGNVQRRVSGIRNTAASFSACKHGDNDAAQATALLTLAQLSRRAAICLIAAGGAPGKDLPVGDVRGEQPDLDLEPCVRLDTGSVLTV
jgi:phosphate/sulfate permease